MNKTLKQWEKQAKDDVENGCDGESYSGAKILALIELIRKKDWIIEEINHQAMAHDDNSLSSKWLENETNEALALTKELK